MRVAHRIAGIAIAAAAVAAAIGGSMLYRAQEQAQAVARAAAADGPAAVAVDAAPVRTGMVRETALAVGTLYAHQMVDISPRIAGHIDRILVAEGQPVRTGDPLVQLDDRVARSALQDADGQLLLAQERFDRSSGLAGRGLATQASVEELRAALVAAQSQQATRRTELDLTTLYAPFDGIAGRRSVDIGSYVQPGQALFRLEDQSTIHVDFRVPARLLPRIAQGMAFHTVLDAVPGRTFVGTVSFIDPEVAIDSRSIELRGEIANGDQLLRPGMFARIELVLDERPDALIVSDEALLVSLAGSYVFRIADGHAERVPVGLGVQRDGITEILDGLRAGDLVVTAGRHRIEHGMPVTVRPAAGGAG